MGFRSCHDHMLGSWVIPDSFPPVFSNVCSCFSALVFETWPLYIPQDIEPAQVELRLCKVRGLLDRLFELDTYFPISLFVNRYCSSSINNLSGVSIDWWRDKEIRFVDACMTPSFSSSTKSVWSTSPEISEFQDCRPFTIFLIFRSPQSGAIHRDTGIHSTSTRYPGCRLHVGG